MIIFKIRGFGTPFGVLFKISDDHSPSRLYGSPLPRISSSPRTHSSSVFRFLRCETSSSICRKILTENSVQMVSAASHAKPAAILVTLTNHNNLPSGSLYQFRAFSALFVLLRLTLFFSLFSNSRYDSLLALSSSLLFEEE